jgi:rRNA processing protein Krr1/Pno1
LDEYLADLDKIKEQIAEEIRGMTPKQVVAYFAKAQRELEQKTGRKLKLRPARPRRRTAASK